MRFIIKTCHSLTYLFILDEDCILEIAFLLDSSESAKHYNHEQQKKFVLEVVDQMKGLQLSSGQTLSWRMALLQYSSTVSTEQTFHDWKGPEAFKSHIAPITYIGHGTYTTYAITNLTQLYMREGTPGSLKLAVLFTDGVDHPRNPDIFAATADAKNQGIVLFTMGMTKVAEEVSNAAKLRLLASVPASRFVSNLQEKGTVEKVLTEMVRTQKCLQTFREMWKNALFPIIWNAYDIKEICNFLQFKEAHIRVHVPLLIKPLYQSTGFFFLHNIQVLYVKMLKPQLN